MCFINMYQVYKFSSSLFFSSSSNLIAFSFSAWSTLIDSMINLTAISGLLMLVWYRAKIVNAMDTAVGWDHTNGSSHSNQAGEGGGPPGRRG
jgi:hypothetical protein